MFKLCVNEIHAYVDMGSRKRAVLVFPEQGNKDSKSWNGSALMKIYQWKARKIKKNTNKLLFFLSYRNVHTLVISETTWDDFLWTLNRTKNEKLFSQRLSLQSISIKLFLLQRWKFTSFSLPRLHLTLRTAMTSSINSASAWD